MSYSTILAQILSTLQGVTGIGTKVYDYERYAATWKEYLDLFKANDLIKGWTITRIATPEETKNVTTNLRTHVFVIRGFYSLDDSAATEKTFQVLIESICTAFREDPTLSGVAFDSGPVQVDTVGPVMFGQVLCHHCELRLPAQEEEQWR